jgi:pyruvate,orthophosphate dikinase
MSGPYTQPLVYSFGGGRADGTAAMKDVLGGKGAGLAEMTTIGIPVPPGFTIASTICQAYLEGGQFPKRLQQQVENALHRLEAATGKHFGDGDNPLLVSVRSGAAVSMPGMMETILNLGLNDVTVEGLTRQSQNPQFAWDSYRRFVQMFGVVVFDLSRRPFEQILEEHRHSCGVERDIDLPPSDMQAIVGRFKEHIKRESGRDFPTHPLDQLWGAIAAVFESWNTRRAIDYRKLHDIPDAMGTAVNVVAMVFGNLGEDSGTGVAFSRDPSTGERILYGEYLLNAQGEDVVSGARTPLQIATLKERLPASFQELERVARTLERHFRDLQDMEFTIERGTLYMLQTRRGQRSGHAAVRVACEMVDEELISEEEAVARIPPNDLNQLLHPTIDPQSHLDLLTKGLPASPGAACGTVVLDADRAERLGRAGQPVILVRRETSPEDFHGMVMAKAVLTARGGMTSHAAVVARGMGKPCVVGAQALQVDERAAKMSVNGRQVSEGDWITVDGSTGKVFAGQAALVAPTLGGDFLRLMQWADRIRQLRVRVNADTPADAHRGRDFGAEGIGLCRTEHMFFDGDRLTAMRQMIVAQDGAGRERALARLLPMQRSDFEAISGPWRAFRSRSGFSILPCTSSFRRIPRRSGPSPASSASRSRHCRPSSTDCTK